jgi:hypothetical protein
MFLDAWARTDDIAGIARFLSGITNLFRSGCKLSSPVLKDPIRDMAQGSPAIPASGG